MYLIKDNIDSDYLRQLSISELSISELRIKMEGIIEKYYIENINNTTTRYHHNINYLQFFLFGTSLFTTATNQNINFLIDSVLKLKI